MDVLTLRDVWGPNQTKVSVVKWSEFWNCIEAESVRMNFFHVTETCMFDCRTEILAQKYVQQFFKKAVSLYRKNEETLTRVVLQSLSFVRSGELVFERRLKVARTVPGPSMWADKSSSMIVDTASAFQEMFFSEPTTYCDGAGELDDTIFIRLATEQDLPYIDKMAISRWSIFQYWSRRSHDGYRLFPPNIVGSITVKCMSSDLDTPINFEHAFHYPESILRSTPERRVAFSVLTNLRQCIFCAVVVSVSKAGAGHIVYNRYHSEMIHPDMFAVEFSSFLGTTPFSLGVRTRFPFHIFVPQLPLGRGSSGAVVSGTMVDGGRSVVVKMSTSLAAMRTETLYLRYIRKEGTDNLRMRTPQPDTAAQSAINGAGLNGHCNAFTTRFDSIHIKHYAGFTKRLFLQLWTVLCDLHALGVVHRDVRHFNCMLVREEGAALDASRRRKVSDPRRPDDRELVLVDFSSCVVYDWTSGAESHFTDVEDVAYLKANVQQGSFNVESDHVLSGGDCRPADEAISFIYCALQTIYHSNRSLCVAQESRESTLNARGLFWGLIKSSSDKTVQTQSKTILTAISEIAKRQALAYNSEEAEVLTGHVRTALDAMFSLTSLY